MSTEPEETRQLHTATIHRQLEHEDGLMVNRLSWLVASQSFLFTAYAIVLNGTSPAQNTALASRQNLLTILLPALGMATGGLIYLGVLAGVRVALSLRRRLRHCLAGTKGIEERLPGTAATHALGLAAPLLLPPLFLVAWATLLWWGR